MSGVDIMSGVDMKQNIRKTTQTVSRSIWSNKQTPRLKSRSARPRIAFVCQTGRTLMEVNRIITDMSSKWLVRAFDSLDNLGKEANEEVYDLIFCEFKTVDEEDIISFQNWGHKNSGTVKVALFSDEASTYTSPTLLSSSCFHVIYAPILAEKIILETEKVLSNKFDAQSSNRNIDIPGFGNMGFDTLNLVPITTIILDKDCKVIFANKLASDMLESKSLLMVGVDQTCRGLYPGATRVLHHKIKALCEEPNNGEITSYLVLPKNHMDNDSISPVFCLRKLQTGICGIEENYVALFMGNTISQNQVPSEIIRQLFGLTGSEAKLVSHLVHGASLFDSADSMGVTINTVRTYLKRIFSKTGTSRQVELVSTVLNSISSPYVTSHYK